jgi:ATP-dependent Clp protease ATP-binding subunit ClpA
MVHLRLDKNIECEKICKLIQESINKFVSPENINDTVMVISFNKISYTTDENILKLELKDCTT